MKLIKKSLEVLIVTGLILSGVITFTDTASAGPNPPIIERQNEAKGPTQPIID